MVVLSLQKVNSDKCDASHTGKHLNKGTYHSLYWFYVVLSVKVKHANIFVVIREGNELRHTFNLGICDLIQNILVLVHRKATRIQPSVQKNRNDILVGCF